MSLLWIIQLCIAEPLKALVVLGKSVYDPGPASLCYYVTIVTCCWSHQGWQWKHLCQSASSHSQSQIGRVVTGQEVWLLYEMRTVNCWTELFMLPSQYFPCQPLQNLLVVLVWCDAVTLMEPFHQLHHFCQHQTDRTFLSQCLHCVKLRSSRPRWN